jgi:phosphate-selective porin OprO/OprP
MGWRLILAALLAAAIAGAILPAATAAVARADVAPPAPGPEKPSPPPGTDVRDLRLHWDLSWEGGINYEIWRPLDIDLSAPGVGTLLGEEVALRGRIGGKINVDSAVFGRTGSVPGVSDGVELRRASIYTTGELRLGLPISFRLGLDFIQLTQNGGNGRLSAGESYLAYKDIPYLGTFYIGNLQTPVGLEDVTSARDLTFMEPASPADAFTSGIKAGVALRRPVFDDRGTWSVGAFANTRLADVGNLSDLASVMGRVTWLPMYWSDAESTTLVHLGLSQAIGASGSGTARFRARPESHLAPFLVDTGDVPADTTWLTGLELAFVRGPVSLQSELYVQVVDVKSGGAQQLTGGYLSWSWIVTGESRPYDTASGFFARLVPRRDLSFQTGNLGALELGLRYSFLDLNDGSIRGGRSNIVMAGLNWYWSRYVKFRVNGGYAAVTGPSARGGLFILQSRLDLDF